MTLITFIPRTGLDWSLAAQLQLVEGSAITLKILKIQSLPILLEEVRTYFGQWMPLWNSLTNPRTE